VEVHAPGAVARKALERLRQVVHVARIAGPRLVQIARLVERGEPRARVGVARIA
jgi:hypothetical protein